MLYKVTNLVRFLSFFGGSFQFAVFLCHGFILLRLVFAASRAKMQTINTISKMRGQSKVNMYPQPEGTLGEYMIKHGRDLGDDNCFGEQNLPTSAFR